MMLPNIKWLKTDGQYGIFQPAKPYKDSKGEVVQRKLFKNQIEFNPPHIPTSITAIPNMLSFFTTRGFFWRPVGVMQVKIKCPNRNCPAPPGSYLNKCGFGNLARQVCGLNYFYTLLTERLQCVHCMKLRKDTDRSVNKESDNENENQQYRWHSYSPSILMNLAPAIRSMFPTILCGKRAIDKNVVTLLSDRLNAVSMTKVQRLVQQGHDEWYTDRRDLYQTLLYEAHTASSMPSQQGILGFIKPEGSYTPPISKTPLPSARVLRRAYLIMEMERIPVYRASILSTTGEILCIDGTRQ
ncbi:uncharacterized protein LOC117123212, partial [Anneissia japonica]|uniref:uncharacterized protein LOC117123212 n=1 Tax=Anneissia japonica TaxID=1529436 RepID=UPI001425597E